MLSESDDDSLPPSQLAKRQQQPQQEPLDNNNNTVIIDLLHDDDDSDNNSETDTDSDELATLRGSVIGDSQLTAPSPTLATQPGSSSTFHSNHKPRPPKVSIEQQQQHNEQSPMMRMSMTMDTTVTMAHAAATNTTASPPLFENPKKKSATNTRTKQSPASQTKPFSPPALKQPSSLSEPSDETVSSSKARTKQKPTSSQTVDTAQEKSVTKSLTKKKKKTKQSIDESSKTDDVTTERNATSKTTKKKKKKSNTLSDGPTAGSKKIKKRKSEDAQPTSRRTLDDTDTTTLTHSPKKKQKKKKLNFQESVHYHLYWSFRPFTVKSLANELKTTEAVLHNVLLSLIDKNLIFQKDVTSRKSGRCKTLYWANYEDQRSKQTKELHRYILPAETPATDQELQAAQVQLQTLVAHKDSLKNVNLGPTNDQLHEQLLEAKASLRTLSTELQACRDRIASNNSGNAIVVAPPPLAYKRRINELRTIWKARKDCCMDVVDVLADGLERPPRDIVTKLLALETDESVGATLPAKHVLE